MISSVWRRVAIRSKTISNRWFSSTSICHKGKTPNLIESEKYQLIKQIEEQIEKLNKVKTQLQNEDDSTSQVSQVTARTARGTQDYHATQTEFRRRILNDVTEVFRLHGAVEIDTPTFELSEILTKKYGEESKNMFDLTKFGGEALSLRYDLTVPFARYMAQHKIVNFKRYQIGKVYRRDDASVSLGRFREFYQCDFDISGNYDPMLPESECLRVISDILHKIGVKDFVIRLNHRDILNGIFEICGVPKAKIQSVCISIDKLDKFPSSVVFDELIKDKGLAADVVEKIGEYVELNGTTELIDKLLNDEQLQKVPEANKSLNEMKLLFKYCEIQDIEHEIIFDLSLARGLDYYTGLIYEAVLKNELITSPEATRKNRFGSLAAGGRYDNLLDIFQSSKKAPCVGLSIGLERICALIRPKTSGGIEPLAYENHVDVFVVSAHRGVGEQKLKIVSDLWRAGIRAEHSYKLSPKLLKQFQHCERFKIPLAIVIGDSELSRDVVLLRDVEKREENEVPLASLADEIRKKLTEMKRNE